MESIPRRASRVADDQTSSRPLVRLVPVSPMNTRCNAPVPSGTPRALQLIRASHLVAVPLPPTNDAGAASSSTTSASASTRMIPLGDVPAHELLTMPRPSVGALMQEASASSFKKRRVYALPQQFDSRTLAAEPNTRMIETGLPVRRLAKGASTAMASCCTKAASSTAS